jgi:hypothetical protein
VFSADAKSFNVDAKVFKNDDLANFQSWQRQSEY